MSVYNLLKQYKTEKNVDRVRFFEFNGVRFTIAACYHLENNKKTGGLYVLDNSDYSLVCKLDLDYGVLDIKEKDEGVFYTTNSDSSMSCFKFNGNIIEETMNIVIPSTDTQNTCNTLDICGNFILLGMNDGMHHIYNIERGEVTISQKGHDYGLWACMFYDECIYLTGSEDSLVKLWDTRHSMVTLVNKTHKASVNTIQQSLNDEYCLLTGSYDEYLRTLDIRKFDACLYETKLCTIWDFKQVNYKEKHLLFTTCVYDGFKIFENNSKEETFSDLYKGPSEHTSIVYGVDVKVDIDKVLVTSCSFYDNMVLLWETNETLFN
jgi:WD40 repeat protein